MAKEWRTRRVSRFYVVAFALLLAVLALGISSSAVGSPACGTANVLSGSDFEIDTDANFTVDGGGTCIDWLEDGTGSGLRSGVLDKDDKPTGSGDDSFGQGSSEDDANPTIVDGSIPPNKSDLLKFGVFTETTATAKFLELFWTRINSPQGTTNMDFELNQKFCDLTATPTNCADNGKNFPAATPIRTAGDRLITYDLSKGGTVPAISIREWDGTAWGPAAVISGAGGSALGSVNTSAIASVDSPTGGTLDPFTFGEAAINFSVLFPSGGSCTTFGSAYLKSRSSDSFTSELKDFIAPEPVQISNCTTLTTSATASVTIGTAISDTATLIGATGTATGSITFKLYGPFDASTPASGDTCVDSGTGANLVTTLGPVAIGSPNGSGSYVVSSGNYTPMAVGRYQWIASYSGDLNNAAASTSCKDAGEASVVNKAQLTVTTNIHDGNHATVTSVALGSTVHDQASLSGVVSGFAAPVVSFTFYTSGDCLTGGTSKTNTGADNGGVRSENVGPLAAGSYSFKASVAGNSFYLGDDSDCEPLTVTKADTTTATEIHDGTESVVTTVDFGTTVHDKATVSGQVGSIAISGSVTFTFYTSGDCLTGGSSAGTVDVSSGVAHPSSSEGPLNAGSYSFQATYSGDSNYNGSTSACEPLTVNKAPSTISTSQTIYLQDRVTISATAGGTPTGGVLFELFGPSDPSCSLAAAFSETKILDGSGSASTTNTGFSVTSASASLYKWRVTYGGDANHDGVTSACGTENSTLTIDNS